MTQPSGTTHISAIVPAAGRSRRMGFLKQHAMIGSRTMLETMMDTLAAGGADRLIVVGNAEVRTRLAAEGSADLLLVENDDPDTEMIDSIRLALAAGDGRFAPAPRDGYLVCPADHPRLSAEDVRACIAAFRDDPGRIVVASFGGKRGHPLIFPAPLVSFVQSAACDSGLNALPRAHRDLLREVPCTSLGVLHDVDTPGDLA